MRSDEQLRATTPPRRSVLPRFVAPAIVAMVGCGLWWFATTLSANAAVHRSNAVDLEIMAIRDSIVRTQLDDMVAQMLAPFGLVTDTEVGDADDARVQTVARGRAALRELVDEPDAPVERIEGLLTVIDDWVPERPDAAPFDLFNGAGSMPYEYVEEPSQQPSSTESIEELAWLDRLPQLVLQEAIIVEFSESPRPTSSDMVGFFRLADAYIATEEAVFGDEGVAPGAGPLPPLDLLAEADQVALLEMVDVLTATDLWTADRVSNGLETNLEPPAFDEIIEQGLAATEALRVVIDERLDAQLATERDAAESAAARHRIVRYVAIGALLVAAAAFVLVLIGQLRRSRELRRRLGLDPLTGVGNRHVLQTDTAVHLARPHLSHHVLVMIDMDRFKLTNDTYGHGVGDRLLQELAAGLTDIAARMQTEASSVIRLGGDEFALTLHDRHPIGRGTVERHLDALQGRLVLIDGDQSIPLAFSYGLSSAEGQPSLDELMESADLAAYDQKAHRHGVVVDTSPAGSPVVDTPRS